MADDQERPAESADGEVIEARARKLRVPRNALRDYLERMRPGRRCSFCEKGTYEAVPAPTGGTAGLLSTPVPYIKGLGIWFYSASCDVCGDTRLFHANHVREAMSEEH